LHETELNAFLDKVAFPSDKKDLSSTKKDELDMWHDWKKSGEHPDKLKPLLKSFKPLIRSSANRWTGVELPPSAVHAEFQKQAVNAFRTYDPKKGTALGSWVTTSMRKAQRWVTTYQNPGRIQEKRLYRIGEFNNAVASLDDQLGREPTSMELSQHLGWSEPEVGRMQSEIRRALPMSGFEGFDPTSIAPSREAEVFKLVRYDLTPEELNVYDYTTGFGGKPMLKPGEISRQLKYSPSKVSRIRNSITDKIKKHL
jgi:hypothetical protein